MSRFVLAYRPPVRYTPSLESRAAWMSWFEGMGDCLALGNPAVARTSLGDCSPQTTELSGFSLIEADDLEAATVIATGCPHLARGGALNLRRATTDRPTTSRNERNPSNDGH
jgi:hypothetical protein